MDCRNSKVVCDESFLRECRVVSNRMNQFFCNTENEFKVEYIIVDNLKTTRPDKPVAVTNKCPCAQLKSRYIF